MWPVGPDFQSLDALRSRRRAGTDLTDRRFRRRVLQVVQQPGGGRSRKRRPRRCLRTRGISTLQGRRPVLWLVLLYLVEERAPRSPDGFNESISVRPDPGAHAGGKLSTRPRMAARRALSPVLRIPLYAEQLRRARRRRREPDAGRRLPALWPAVAGLPTTQSPGRQDLAGTTLGAYQPSRTAASLWRTQSHRELLTISLSGIALLTLT